MFSFFRGRRSKPLDEQARALLSALEGAKSTEVVRLVSELTADLTNLGLPASYADRDVAEMLAEVARCMGGLVSAFPHLDVEARKDVRELFCLLVHIRTADSVYVLAKYVAEEGDGPDILHALLDGYQNPELSVHTGLMLRELVKHRCIVEAAFARPGFVSKAWKYGASTNVDVATDAFATLRELLVSTHKKVAAAYAKDNFDAFFTNLHELLHESEYFALRLTLRLLSEILVDKAYIDAMLMYVHSVEFLKIHMDFLRSKSKAIRQDAFHVFKLFAANPNKPPKVERILCQNRERLIALLTTGLVDEADDAFEADKNAVLTKIAALQPLQTVEAAVSA
jgi:calcium binding protein 39